MLKLTELGTQLKEARLSKGYSLDDLQEITKIQKRYLVGIEEGNYSIMPGTFYVRAFIKQYAEAVGLKSEELLEQYKNEVPNTHPDEVTQSVPYTPTRRTCKIFRSNDGNSTKIHCGIIYYCYYCGDLVPLFSKGSKYA